MEIQLAQLIRQNDPEDILKNVREIYLRFYSSLSFMQIEYVFRKTIPLFSGNFPGYSACNTEYHNLDHTLDAFLATARLMDGKNISEEPFSETLAMRLLISALMHDTGYIQESGDTGTGAKYTSIHVERSISFVRKNAEQFTLNTDDVLEIGTIIACTGLKNKWGDIPFTSTEEMKAGAVLASADILGQMSDRQYLEKLLFLYYEFREADIPGFETEFDILRKTEQFYEGTKVRLEKTLLAAYEYARYHFKERLGIDRNLYIEAIERQIAYLRKIISDDTTNFRHKLKRVDLEQKEMRYRA
jgi:hypothetical protein